MKVIQWTKCQHSKTSNGFFKACMKKTTRLLITSLQWGHVITVIITDLNSWVAALSARKRCISRGQLSKEHSKGKQHTYYAKYAKKCFQNSGQSWTKMGQRSARYRSFGTGSAVRFVHHRSAFASRLPYIWWLWNVSDCFRNSGFPMCCLLLATLWIIRCHGRDVLHKDPKALGPKQVWLGGLDGLDTLGWGKSASTISDENLPSTF